MNIRTMETMLHPGDEVDVRLWLAPGPGRFHSDPSFTGTLSADAWLPFLAGLTSLLGAANIDRGTCPDCGCPTHTAEPCEGWDRDHDQTCWCGHPKLTAAEEATIARNRDQQSNRWYA